MGDHEATGKGNFALNNKAYQVLKWLAGIVLPAAATAYFTLGGLWEWPNVDQTVGTIVVIETFLGVVLGISTKSYNNSDKAYDGDLVTDDSDPYTEHWRLEINGGTEALAAKDEIKLKVKPAPAQDSQE